LQSAPARDWNNVCAIAKKHAAIPARKRTEHQLCVARAEGFIRVFRGNQVPALHQLQEEKRTQIANNRHVLLQIMKMLHRMGKQNVAIRGHTDERSNFTVFLNAQAEFDKILAAHLTKVANKKKTYWKESTRFICFSPHPGGVHSTNWRLFRRTCP